MASNAPPLLARGAEFVLSAPGLRECPPPGDPEIAVAGRSNVGKSSLLNFLVNQRGLARVSNTPGRTRLLNFFRARLSDERSTLLVDLPGYGFARMPEEAKRAFGPMIEGYLLRRESLRGLALLIDIRRGPEDEEQQLIRFCQDRQLPVVLVVTKTDELPKSKRFPRAEEIRHALGLKRRPILTSVRENLGREEVWRALGALLSPPPAPASEPAPAATEAAPAAEPVTEG